MHVRRFVHVLTLFAALHSGRAQGPLAGRIDERLVAVDDTAQRYAQYLPSSYRADRRWPVLFVLDPRGRGLHALRLFVEGAERYGYVVLSSYNSLSDSARCVRRPARPTAWQAHRRDGFGRARPSFFHSMRRAPTSRAARRTGRS